MLRKRPRKCPSRPALEPFTHDMVTLLDHGVMLLQLTVHLFSNSLLVRPAFTKTAQFFSLSKHFLTVLLTFTFVLVYYK